MNLGVIYLKSFFLIIAGSLLVALALAATLRYWRCSWRTVLVVALPLWLVMGFAALQLGHPALFAAWHRWQNVALPQQGYLSYQPEFWQLYATYELPREVFESWVSTHPWQLHAGSNGLLPLDGPRLSFDNPEDSYETEPAPNGQQLRVYYKSGIMYVSYNAW